MSGRIGGVGTICPDGPQQVVLLPEVEINKNKKAHIEISTVRCVANCMQ